MFTWDSYLYPHLCICLYFLLRSDYAFLRMIRIETFVLLRLSMRKILETWPEEMQRWSFFYLLFTLILKTWFLNGLSNSKDYFLFEFFAPRPVLLVISFFKKGKMKKKNLWYDFSMFLCDEQNRWRVWLKSIL